MARKIPSVQGRRRFFLREHAYRTTTTVSLDLPLTQARWSVVAEASDIVTYSDHRDASFGLAYGVLIKELRLLARSVFVVDGSDVIRHVQIVPDVTSLPNFDAVLRAVREAM